MILNILFPNPKGKQFDELEQKIISSSINQLYQLTNIKFKINITVSEGNFGERYENLPLGITTQVITYKIIFEDYEYNIIFKRNYAYTEDSAKQYYYINFLVTNLPKKNIEVIEISSQTIKRKEYKHKKDFIDIIRAEQVPPYFGDMPIEILVTQNKYMETELSNAIKEILDSIVEKIS